MEIISERQALDMPFTGEAPPMVAVEMITYNHEKFISQAIESVLMQKTSFDYKLIICEDSSTDKTAEICLDYKRRFPDKIDLHLNEKNLGISLNAKKLHEASYNSGARYVAILEGDDYWTDESKLQKQFDFLESHPDFSLCYHKVKWVFTYENGYDPDIETNEGDPPVSTILDVLTKGWFIRSCSVFYRNFKLPENYHKLYIGDYPLHVLLADKGNIGFINQCIATYRINDQGFSEQNLVGNNYEKRKKILDNEVFMINYLYTNTGKKYKKYFDQRKYDAIYSYMHFVLTTHKRKILTVMAMIVSRFNLIFLLRYSFKKIITFFRNRKMVNSSQQSFHITS